jgi:hypothetical protein
MDDFFLPFEQKTPERLAQPGGNADHERFAREVLGHLNRGEAFAYRRYDCGAGILSPIRCRFRPRRWLWGRAPIACIRLHGNKFRSASF